MLTYSLPHFLCIYSPWLIQHQNLVLYPRIHQIPSVARVQLYSRTIWCIPDIFHPITLQREQFPSVWSDMRIFLVCVPLNILKVGHYMLLPPYNKLLFHWTTSSNMRCVSYSSLELFVFVIPVIALRATRHSAYFFISGHIINCVRTIQTLHYKYLFFAISCLQDVLRCCALIVQ